MPPTTSDTAADARSQLARHAHFLAFGHLDHSLSEDLVLWICEVFTMDPELKVRTVQVPAHLEPISSALYGPICGDAPVLEPEVTYARRGDRSYESRLCARPARPTRTLTVITGPHQGHGCVLYTAFGGPLTPKEPGDPTLTAENRDFAEKFWAEHALSAPLTPTR
jgi:hypothetical protein